MYNREKRKKLCINKLYCYFIDPNAANLNKKLKLIDPFIFFINKQPPSFYHSCQQPNQEQKIADFFSLEKE